MSAKDKIADWYNMETRESLCCYRDTYKDELLLFILRMRKVLQNSWNDIYFVILWCNV